MIPHNYEQSTVYAARALKSDLRVRRTPHRLVSMQIRIEVPDDLAAALKRTPGELEYDLRLRALAGLVERGLISSGKAAALAGVGRLEFLDWCGRWQIILHRWSEEDLAADLAYADHEARDLESGARR